MSDQPTERQRRDAIEKTARDWQRTVHRSGNPTYTLDQARQRVTGAVRRGDRIRDNGNR